MEKIFFIQIIYFLSFNFSIYPEKEKKRHHIFHKKFNFLIKIYIQDEQLLKQKTNKQNVLHFAWNHSFIKKWKPKDKTLFFCILKWTLAGPWWPNFFFFQKTSAEIIEFKCFPSFLKDLQCFVHKKVYPFFVFFPFRG